MCRIISGILVAMLASCASEGPTISRSDNESLATTGSAPSTDEQRARAMPGALAALAAAERAAAPTEPPALRAFAPIQRNADKSITVGDHTYSDMQAFVRSAQFRAEGRRCGTITPISDDAAFAPTDCSGSGTSIQPHYDPERVYEIPVVFHIISASNGTGNIPDEAVHSQIEILNEDYLALPGRPGAQGNDSRIRFALATIDPSGNPATGIMRYTNDNWFNNNQDPGRGDMKTAINWNPTLYLNIYTNSASGALGYAYLPTDGAGAVYDGVVLLWQAVGRNAPLAPYDQGRTATHEVGHYLGLYHTFDNGCGNNASPYNSGDLIADTVPETEAHYHCVASNTACAGATGPNPIHNYMEYTNDTCMWEFSPEQINRMRCSIVHYRAELFNEAPEAAFSQTPNDLSFSFTDMSSDGDGTIVSWSWDFGDGGTSTEQNPQHDFGVPGTYQVSLTVTDNRGSQSTTTVPLLANPFPIAGFTYTADGLCVTFADTSTDNGSVTGWSWSLGDGKNATEQSPVHVYDAPGTYTVTLAVTDNDGATTMATREIIVEDGGCACRVGTAGGRSSLPWAATLLLGLALIAIRRR